MTLISLEPRPFCLNMIGTAHSYHIWLADQRVNTCVCDLYISENTVLELIFFHYLHYQQSLIIFFAAVPK